MTSNSFKPVDEQLAYLKKGVDEIIPEAEFRAKLEKSFNSGVPLRVYLGVDPTAPDLHLGHTVVLRKLKHFQDMGHTAVFLIGDFSAMIGDPTGVSETRPPLTREQVDANAKTYLAQVFKILDRDKTVVCYNSEWLGKLSAEGVVRLCGRYRLARLLEREDFSSRLENNQPISVHELLYPLLTALDAVELRSDVEIGATEQKFNLLVHREIQIADNREKALLDQLEDEGKKVTYERVAQVCLTMPILVGLDGKRKMSKSLGNYIGINEPPADMFGKILSISDETMWDYYKYVTDRTPQQIAALETEVSSGALHPMDAKMRLAEEIVSGFHGPDPARKAAENFQRVFRDRQAPAEMKEFVVKRMPMGHSVRWKTASSAGSQMFTDLPKGPEKWSKLLARLGEATSASEAERLMKQGGFELNGAVATDPACKINLGEPGSYEVRVGKKRFLRLIVE
jgi:tyrosyl-tRNA synthetase